MFFRRKATPSGHVLQLLESYRNSTGQPRQRVVASLGDAAIPEADWPAVARAVERRLYGREELFPWEHEESQQGWIDRIVRQVDLRSHWRPKPPSATTRPAAVPAERAADSGAGPILDGVLLDEVGHEQSAPLGPALVAWHAWKALRLDACLAELGLNEAQRLAAAAEVVNRLVEPRSEHALQEWLRSTAMPELFGEKILRGSRDRFYRVTETLHQRGEALEAHLRARQRELFSLRRTLLLYDLTNTYFEGECLQNPKARRSKNSKEKRSDCPQIVVGMVFDEHGFELAHRIFEGNRTDSPTLPMMIAALQRAAQEEADLWAEARPAPLVIVDGGLSAAKNLKALREAGFRYVVSASRQRRSTYRAQFAEDEAFAVIGGREGKRPVRVRRILDPKAKDGEPDELLLCKSGGRQEKEHAIRSRAEEKLLEQLQALAKRVAEGRLKDEIKIQRTIGRILAAHPRVARYYDVALEEAPEDGPEPGIRRVVYWAKHEALDADEELLGCYVLRASAGALSDEELWHTYMTLTRAEDGFRALKGDLGLRPNRHHVERRVDAHVFVTILAYHLLRFILHKLESKGDTRRWETIKAILSTHCYTTIVLPTAGGGTIRKRRAGNPEETQKAIYRALGIDWRRLPVRVDRLP